MNTTVLKAGLLAAGLALPTMGNADPASCPLLLADYWRDATAPEVECCIDAGADIHARTEGVTPLHQAAFAGHAEAITALLEGGADVDARDNLGRTALWWAAANSHAQVVTALLAADADASARTKDGKTPFNLAKGKNRDKLKGTGAWQRLHDAQYE